MQSTSERNKSEVFQMKINYSYIIAWQVYIIFLRRLTKWLQFSLLVNYFFFPKIRNVTILCSIRSIAKFKDWYLRRTGHYVREIFASFISLLSKFEYYCEYVSSHLYHELFLEYFKSDIDVKYSVYLIFYNYKQRHMEVVFSRIILFFVNFSSSIDSSNVKVLSYTNFGK